MSAGLTGAAGLVILVVAAVAALAADAARQWLVPADGGVRRGRRASWVLGLSLLAVLLTALAAVSTFLRLFALT